jgi:hypothetical protein
MIFYLQKNILMKYNLSIIIAHYFSHQSGMLNPLQKTLTTIQDQVDDFNVEIIIEDDGSSYSESIVENYSKR